MPNDTKTLSQLMQRLKNAEADPLSHLIDEYIMIRDTPEAKGRVWSHEISMVPRPRPGGRFSPSSVFGCERAAVFKFVGMRGRRRLDVDQELLFEDGNWRHHKWQALFYDMQAVLGRDRFRVISIEEGILIPELYVAGSLDVHIKIKLPNGKWRSYIIDIKGINRRGFDWINKQDEPKTEAVRQLLLYMKAKGVKRGLLLYDCKDTSHTKVYQVAYTSEYWDETIDWIKRVIRKIERQRIPQKPVECRPGTMMYDHCPFVGLCYGNTLDSTDLAEIAYKDFEGIEETWRRALEEFAA